MESLAQGPQICYYHYDGLGSVTDLSDSEGSHIEHYAYSPFGKTKIYSPATGMKREDSIIGNPYRFTGRRWDEESQLYYYRARMYDPKLARFLQTDPIGYDSGDLNLYRYCGNNPLNLVDPTGLETIIIHGIGAGHEPGYSGQLADQLRAQGEVVWEFHWSGDIGDTGKTISSFKEAASFVSARSTSKGESFNVIAHSYGGLISYSAISSSNVSVDNYITMGSPLGNVSTPSNVSNWTNFFSFIDPISSYSFGANNIPVLSNHTGYWSHSTVIGNITESVSEDGK
jgi:RHS repeat-associated protein